MAMQVTVPEGISGGQLVQIQTLNGMMQVTVPPDLQGGAIFHVHIPNMPSPAPNAPEVTADIPTATVAGVGDRDHNMQTAASLGQEPPKFCADCGASLQALIRAIVVAFHKPQRAPPCFADDAGFWVH